MCVWQGPALAPAGTRGEEDAPEYEIRMSQEVRYAFEHAPGLEDERWKGDL
jgi:hypothetical protein